jgi:hypothetical protein
MSLLYYGGWMWRDVDVANMRAWLDDCRGMWDDIEGDLEDTIAELSDEDVLRAVDRHYAGGIHGWLADDEAIGPLGGSVKPSEW